MGFTAGCVLWEGTLPVREVVKVVAKAAKRASSGEGEVLVCPSLPLQGLGDDFPVVGLAAFLAEPHPGNDLIAHALHRKSSRPVVAVISSDFHLSAAYELCLPEMARPSFEDDRIVWRDAAGREVPRAELRESGALSIIGSTSIAGRTTSYVDIPRLALEALLGPSLEFRSLDIDLASLFDLAFASPETTVTTLAPLGAKIGRARRLDPSRAPDVHTCSWGFTLWPAGATGAQSRYDQLSSRL